MLYKIHNSLSEHYKNNGHTLYIFGVHVTQIVYGDCKNTPPYNALALWFEPKWPRVFLLRPSNSCLLISYLSISVFIYICSYFYTHELIHTPSPILNSWHGFWTCVSTVQNLYLAGDDAGRARRNGEKIYACEYRFKLSRHYLWTISRSSLRGWWGGRACAHLAVMVPCSRLRFFFVSGSGFCQPACSPPVPLNGEFGASLLSTPRRRLVHFPPIFGPAQGVRKRVHSTSQYSSIWR